MKTHQRSDTDRKRNSLPTSRLVFLLFLLLLYAPGAFGGGDSLHTVILSPLVGRTIDHGDREYYGVFRSVDWFKSARLFATDNQRFLVVFTLKDPSGASRESTTVISQEEVFRLSETIDHVDEIRNGRYILGSSKATISIDGRSITRVPIVGPYAGLPEKIPLGEPMDPKPGAMQWVFFISAGAVFYPIGFKEIDDMYAAIEARYAARGYPISGTPKSFSSPPRVAYAITIRPFHALSLIAEASPPSSSKELSIGYVSGFMDYALPLDRFSRLRWHFGLGYSWFKIAMKRTYPNIKISPAEPSTGYFYYLSSIDAQVHSGGISGETAITYAPADPWEFLLYGRYTFIADQGATLGSGSTAALHLHILQCGIRLQIGLY